MHIALMQFTFIDTAFSFMIMVATLRGLYAAFHLQVNYLLHMFQSLVGQTLIDISDVVFVSKHIDVWVRFSNKSPLFVAFVDVMP